MTLPNGFFPRRSQPHASLYALTAQTPATQLLLSPPLLSRISSIFFTRSKNSSYWHFS